MLQICVAFTAISTHDLSSEADFQLHFTSTPFFNFSRQYHYLPRGPYDHLNSRPVVEGFPTLYFHNAGAFSGICRYIVIQRACTAGMYGLDDHVSSESLTRRTLCCKSLRQTLRSTVMRGTKSLHSTTLSNGRCL